MAEPEFLSVKIVLAIHLTGLVVLVVKVAAAVAEIVGASAGAGKSLRR